EHHAVAGVRPEDGRRRVTVGVVRAEHGAVRPVDLERIRAGLVPPDAARVLAVLHVAGAAGQTDTGGQRLAAVAHVVEGLVVVTVVVLRPRRGAGDRGRPYVLPVAGRGTRGVDAGTSDGVNVRNDATRVLQIGGLQGHRELAERRLVRRLDDRLSTGLSGAELSTRHRVKPLRAGGLDDEDAVGTVPDRARAA